jgi:SAM-dependent MidA family methyltransferase
MVFSDVQATPENAALKDIILEAVGRAGRLPFSDFMELALYHPVHGYYVTQDPARDYQSSPNVHPIFGAVLASQIAEFWRLLGQPDCFQVFEAGAGRGELAADIVRWLRSHEPDLFDAIDYTIHDRALNMSAADETLARLGLPDDCLRVASGLPPEGSLVGCILTNELLDAFPVRRVIVDAGKLLELYVTAEGEAFREVADRPSPEVAAYFEALDLMPGEGCFAEVNLAAPAWMASASASLRRGYVLTLDYGYPAPELYAPWRRQGTLLTFYRHTSGEDPFVRIGRQDMTASVDFTTLTRAGEAAGLRTLGLTTQARFLSALGIWSALEGPRVERLESFFALRKAVTVLTDPAGLGRVKVLVQGKDVPDILPRGLREP